MKNVLSTLMVLFLGIWLHACASTPLLVDKQFREYHPCQAKYCSKMNNWTKKCTDEDTIVNFNKLYCFHYCSERSFFGNCQKYSMDTIDPNSTEIRNMNFHLKIPDSP